MQNVGYEVRAGLSSVYAANGWVASDIHSEAGSRTLDYACKDFEISKTSLLTSNFQMMTTQCPNSQNI